MLYRTTSEMKIPNAEGVDGSTKPRNILFWCVYVDRSDARIMRQLSGIIILPYTVSGQCHHRQHVDRFKNRLDSESAILISRIVTCRANSFRCYILESHPWLVPPPESRILLRSRNTFLFWVWSARILISWHASCPPPLIIYLPVSVLHSMNLVVSMPVLAQCCRESKYHGRL